MYIFIVLKFLKIRSKVKNVMIRVFQYFFSTLQLRLMLLLFSILPIPQRKHKLSLEEKLTCISQSDIHSDILRLSILVLSFHSCFIILRKGLIIFRHLYFHLYQCISYICYQTNKMFLTFVALILSFYSRFKM